MIKVDVILKNEISPAGPSCTIRMSIEEYTDFIKEQAELLGIKEREESTRTAVVNVDTKNLKNIDEVMKEIEKAMRRNKQC